MDIQKILEGSQDSHYRKNTKIHCRGRGVEKLSDPPAILTMRGRITTRTEPERK